MNHQALLTLRYHGGEAAQGEMDHYAVAANIIAFGDYLGVLSRTVYGERAELRTTIQGFRQDSFGIEFVLHIGGVLATLLTGPSTPKQLWDLIKMSFDAWKFLHGEPPKAVTQEGERVSLTNVHGDNRYFSADTIIVVTDEKAGAAAEQFVRKPLESGIERMEIIARDAGTLASATAADARAFTVVAPQAALLESTFKTALEIIAPVFKEGNKWRVSDGQATFSVSVEDADFLARVERGEERFGKGDLLLVELQVRQTQRLRGLRAERVVTRVLKHTIPAEQGTLF